MDRAYQPTPPLYVKLEDPNHFNIFSSVLYSYLQDMLPSYNHQVVILCIGTDRATGDSLGPLIGYKLSDMCFRNVVVFGTLESPIHAKNLVSSIELIQQDYPHALIIAIDACLGNVHNIGSITLGKGSIKPGAGVQKKLPEVGHLHITGIVNFSSLTNMAVLQNTRLATVMKMADIISSSLRYCLWQYYRQFH